MGGDAAFSCAAATVTKISSSKETPMDGYGQGAKIASVSKYTLQSLAELSRRK